MGDAVEGVVELIEGMQFRARAGSGHSVVLDAAPGVGGANAGPRPIELLLLGLGGCTGMDVISILRKMRQEVTGYAVQLHADRAEAYPKVFTAVHVEHVVRGRHLNPDLVRRAVELSATRYCPAAAMLGKAAPITETFRVVDDDTGEEVAVGTATEIA